MTELNPKTTYKNSNEYKTMILGMWYHHLACHMTMTMPHGTPCTWHVDKKFKS